MIRAGTIKDLKQIETFDIFGGNREQEINQFTCYLLLITFLRGSTSAVARHVAHALRAIK